MPNDYQDVLSQRKLTIEIPDELHTELKSAAPRQGLTIRGIALQAFELWFEKIESKKTANRSLIFAKLSQSDERWHRDLHDILHSGNKEWIEMVCLMISGYAKLVRRRQRYNQETRGSNDDDQSAVG